ncbi:MAG: MarR family winged helix-turn-helix transcriptional regulator [Caulobacteraceae bacterium]
MARPGHLLRRTHQASALLFVQEVADLDMTQPRFEALTAIAKYPRADQISLARGLGIDRSTTTLILDGLAKCGLIERTAHPDDRRKRLLETTAAGRAALAGARKHADAAQARLLAPLNHDEIEALIADMVTVVTAVPSSAPDLAGMAQRESTAWVPRQVAFLVRRCRQVSHAILGDALRPFEITPQQYGIMYVLAIAQADEAEVSRLMAVERSAVDKVLRRLKSRGYLERCPQSETLRLTTAGETAFQTMRGPHETADRTVLLCLSADRQAQFMSGLLKLVAHHQA